MRKGVATLRTMSLGIVAGLVWVIQGCSPCPEHSSRRNLFNAMAPDGSALVRLNQINTFAGSSFKYEVSLHLQNGGSPSFSVLWRSNGCEPIYVFWVTDRLVELHVRSEVDNPNCEEELQEAKHARYRWNDYEVEIVPIQSLYKRDLLASGRY